MNKSLYLDAIRPVVNAIRGINVPIMHVIEHLDDFNGVFTLEHLAIQPNTVVFYNTTARITIDNLFEKWYVSGEFNDKKLDYIHFTEFSDAFKAAVDFIRKN
jgi:hypothetical protein